MTRKLKVKTVSLRESSSAPQLKQIGARTKMARVKLHRIVEERVSDNIICVENIGWFSGGYNSK